jgi:hypothetical protein
MHSYYDLLISLGAHITNKGCRYIAEAILLLQKKDPSSWPTAGQLYQQVAHKFQVSPCSVSRAVSRVIIHIWSLGNRQKLQEIIGCVFPEKPTPANFIFMLANYMNSIGILPPC